MKKLLRPIFNIYSNFFGLGAKYFHPFFPFQPLRLTLYITKKCNLTCGYCYTKDALNTPEPNSLTFDEWKLIIDSLPINTVIDFCGGEVFFAKDIYKILEYISKKRRPISLITNGTTMTEKSIDFFIDNKITYYMNSLDGMETYHDSYRGKKGVFKQSLKMLQYLHKRKAEKKATYPISCIKMMITPENYGDVPKMLHFAEHIAKVDNLQFSLVYNNKHRMVFETFDDPDQIDNFEGSTFDYPLHIKPKIKEAILSIIEYKKTSKIFIGIDPRMPSDLDLLDYIDNPKSFGVKSCNRHWSEVFLHYDGTLSSCVSINLGNIRDHNYNIKKTLSTGKALKYLKKMDSLFPFNEQCRTCCKADHCKI